MPYFLLYIFLGFLFVLLFANPTMPSAHSFMTKVQKSSMPLITTSVILTPPLSLSMIWSSAYLFSAGIFFEASFDFSSSILAGMGSSILEHMMQNTIRLSSGASVYLDNPTLDLGQLSHMHGLLTPHMSSYDSIFSLMMDWVNFFDFSDSEHFHILEDMQGRYREAGNDLLEVYRSMETLMNIPIQDSPIAVQDWEYV